MGPQLTTASNTVDPSSVMLTTLLPCLWKHDSEWVLLPTIPLFPKILHWLVPGTILQVSHRGFSSCLWRGLLTISSSDLSPRLGHFHFPTAHPHSSFPQALWTERAQTENIRLHKRSLLLTILTWPMASPCSQLPVKNQKPGNYP